MADPNIQRAKEIQQWIKNGDLTVSEVAEKSGVNRVTINNLKNDKVNPEKMTKKMLDKLNLFYDSPLNPMNGAKTTDRDYFWGQVYGIMSLIFEHDLRILEQFSSRPLTVFKKAHEIMMSTKTKKYDIYVDDLTSAVAQMPVEFYTDDPLGPVYLLASSKARLAYKK